MAWATLNGNSVVYAWNDGGGWSAPVTVQSGVFGAAVGRSAVVVDNVGRIHLVWEHRTSPTATSIAYYRQCEGSTCGPVYPLTQLTPQTGYSLYPLATPPASKQPAVVVDSTNHLMAVWAQYEPGGVYLPYDYWLAGEPPPAERTGCAPANSYLAPVLAADATGVIHMASSTNVIATESRDALYGTFANGQWSAITRIFYVVLNNPNGTAPPGLAVEPDGSRVHLAGCSRINFTSGNRILGYFSKTGEGSWSAREIVPLLSNECSGAAALTLDGTGRVWAGWRTSAPSGIGNIVVSVRESVWSSAHRAVNCVCRVPALGADTTGKLHLVFARTNNFSVYPMFYNTNSSGTIVQATPTPTATPVITAPPRSVSRYIGWTGEVGTFSNVAFYSQGCSEAQKEVADGLSDAMVILNFGQPWRDENNQLGTIIFTSPDYYFVPYYDIEVAIMYYIMGYSQCATDTIHLTLAVGVNNDWRGEVTLEHGNEWGKMIQRIYNWALRHECFENPLGCSFKQVYVVGAIDAEAWQGQADAQAAKNWVDGYTDATSPSPAKRQPFYNFGTCDSCPWTDHDWVPYWSQSDLWYLSWGARRAYSAPQIYYRSHADQWVHLRDWAVSQNLSRIYFSASITEAGACEQHQNKDATCPSNQPSQGWLDLFQLAQQLSLPWSTDFRYDTVNN